MRRPNDFDQVQAAGGFPTIELGGHIIIIQDVRVEKITGGVERIVLKYDMHSTDKQPNFFNNAFNADTRPDRKWRGVHRQPMFNQNGGTNAFFKNLTDSIKASNPGWEVPFDDNDPNNVKFCNGFKGKIVGAVYGREQYEDQATGTLKFATKINIFTTVEEIKKGVEVPKDKLKINSNNNDGLIPTYDNGDMPF